MINRIDTVRRSFIFRGNRAQPGGIKVREEEALPEYAQDNHATDWLAFLAQWILVLAAPLRLSEVFHPYAPLCMYFQRRFNGVNGPDGFDHRIGCNGNTIDAFLYQELRKVGEV